MKRDARWPAVALIGVKNILRKAIAVSWWWCALSNYCRCMLCFLPVDTEHIVCPTVHWPCVHCACEREWSVDWQCNASTGSVKE